MRRETAYKLAGRRHEQQISAAGLLKTRELRFKKLPVGQAARAMAGLRRIKGLHVEAGVRETELVISYSILEHTLEDVENALRDAGFGLDNTLYSKLVRALVYFTEETQRHNLESPERLIKKSHEAYVHAWDQHEHGDHDDAPPELREYK